MNHERACLGKLIPANRARVSCIPHHATALSQMGIARALVAEKLPTLPAAMDEGHHSMTPAQMLNQRIVAVKVATACTCCSSTDSQDTQELLVQRLKEQKTIGTEVLGWPSVNPLDAHLHLRSCRRYRSTLAISNKLKSRRQNRVVKEQLYLSDNSNLWVPCFHQWQ